MEVKENGELSKFIFDRAKVATELDKGNNLKDSLLHGYEIISKKDDIIYQMLMEMLRDYLIMKAR